MVMPPGEVGAYLVHFTGSAAHNVRLRGLARDRGWSLSEQGFVRLGDDGRPLEGTAADRRAFATEAEVYAFLDLPYIEPELREDGGEIEAAEAGPAAGQSRQGDLQGDAHSHPIGPTATFDRGGRRGDAPPRPRLPGPDRPFAQPDHRPRADHRASRATAGHIAELNARFAREEADDVPRAPRRHSACCTAARWRSASMASWTIPTSCWRDTTWSWPACTSAADNRAAHGALPDGAGEPHVDIIAHPSRSEDRCARRPRPTGALRGAAESSTLLEINGSDERLDLADGRIRAAHAPAAASYRLGRHYRHGYDNRPGASALRERGWLEASDVINTRSARPSFAWMAGDRDV
jgi:DNA polymerase (family 10)